MLEMKKYFCAVIFEERDAYRSLACFEFALNRLGGDVTVLPGVIGEGANDAASVIPEFFVNLRIAADLPGAQGEGPGHLIPNLFVISKKAPIKADSLG